MAWDDLHESVQVWYAWRSGWPSWYPSLLDMPIVVAAGFQHLALKEAEAAALRAREASETAKV